MSGDEICGMIAMRALQSGKTVIGNRTGNELSIRELDMESKGEK
ncbi:hypothetical protein LCGC14_1527600 [marine sediment metagenome]|uniref:Uncharacterized protein n=1 Tax=marine sediment metagenome TaxID=412755 RepID=A0A0F9LCF1_9ZZZZ